MTPKVFISYSHDSPEQADRILAFSNRLRADGVDAIIDQYNPHPPEGWPLWMDTKIKHADFVLMVCTKTYHERVMSDEEPGIDGEALREAHLIREYIDRPSTMNARFVPVLFGDLTAEYIPAPVAGVARYRFDTAEGYEDLFRLLTRQPKATKPRLGKIQAMRPRERKTDFFPPWNIPYPRNIYFTGREDVLTALHGALKSSHAAALSQPQAISGLGGIGKTQIAVEYAYRHRDEYTAFLWVPSDSREAIISGFVALARFLNLPEKDEQDQDLAVGAVTGWLDSHIGWLLIFDNADNPGLIEEFLPPDVRGDILLTSRARAFDVRGVGEPLEVRKIEPPEARRFLIARADHALIEGEDAGALNDIVKEFDGLPLALELTGAYMLQMKCTFREYLSAYRKRGLALLRQMPPVIGKYPQSVAATWLLNFQEVATISPASADILRTSAFLSPERIPFEVLVSGAKELGPAVAAALASANDDPLLLNEVLAPLARFSLIRIESRSRTYEVQRAGQAVLRNIMDGPTRHIWSERAVRAVNESFPSTESSNWPACERLIDHALACAGLIDQEHFEFGEAVRLLNQGASYLHDRTRYDRAEPLYERALDILEKSLGPDHPKVATCLNNLAELYDDQKRYGEAEPLYKRALEIDERAYGPDHPEVAADLNNLATLHNVQGRFGEAEPLYMRALEVLEQSLGPDHPNVVMVRNNLASLRRRMR